MQGDDKVFKDVCDLLARNNINFWICHGTLLGVIRESRLLPWDDDIDFAVWNDEVNKDMIINIFEDNGYIQEFVFGDMDCLHFFGENKNIDISFYKKNQNTASVVWAVPPNSFFAKVGVYFTRIICTKKLIKIEPSENLIKTLLYWCFMSLSLPFRYIFPTNLKDMIYKSITKYIDIQYMGYSYPLDLMVFKKIEYKGIAVQVPVDADKCLEITYGKEWRHPQANYVWYKEADNLTVLKGH